MSAYRAASARRTAFAKANRHQPDALRSLYACRSMVDNHRGLATTTRGALVLADISGYTQYLTESELEHSREILSELLNEVVTSLQGRLTVSNLEGDAVFFIGTGIEGDLGEPLRRTFVAFHRRVREMVPGTTCTCAACRNIGNLTLKFAVHYGTFTTQRVGGAEQVIGSDVILAHRLLKNSVPSHEYILATREALEHLGVGGADVVQHVEEYEHVGRVEGAYSELAPVWIEAEARERKRVEPGEARIAAGGVIAAPIAAVWRVLIDPGLRHGWMGVPRVTVKPGARGTLQGAEYHCHHGRNRVSVFRVVNAVEERELSEDWGSFMGVNNLFCTITLEAIGPSETRIRSLLTWDDPRTLPQRLAAAAMQAVMGSKLKGAPRKMQEMAIDLAGRPEATGSEIGVPACTYRGAESGVSS